MNGTSGNKNSQFDPKSRPAPTAILNRGILCPKPTVVKDATPQQPLLSNLHRSSNSYFPYPKNRVSLNSTKSSEISGFVEESKILESTRTSDPTVYLQSPVPQTDSTNASDFSSFYIDEGEEQKFAYNSKKIFVGGLPHGLTETEFKQYFVKYGEIEDCVVMYDRNTGKPRGFGFITYKDEQSIDLVLQQKFQHKIRNKWIECKRATPKVASNTQSSSVYDQSMDTTYTYTSDPMLLPCNYEPLARKLSVENLAYPTITDTNSGQISQTTSPNPFFGIEEDTTGRYLFLGHICISINAIVAFTLNIS